MKDVFCFTFRQNTKVKGFLISAVVVPVLICIICIIVSVITASGDADDEDAIDTVEKLYITNESDMAYINFDYFGFEGCIVGERAPGDEDKALDVIIKNGSKDDYIVNVRVPVWSVLDEKDAAMVMDYMLDYVERLGRVNKVMKESGNTDIGGQLMQAFTPVMVNYISEGDDDANLGASLFNKIIPMIIVMMLYFMAIIYGQSIGKSVISEKVSKLIETLLITVKPFDLIAGKVLAMALVAILQMGMWITGLISGIFIGDAVGRIVNPDFNNVVINAVNLMRESGEGVAFSVPSLIISTASLLVGFLFVCVFAGLVSSPVSKAEELSSCFSIYQIVIIISFMVSYFIPLSSGVGPALDVVIHAIPFTAVFMLPGDVLVGNVGAVMGSVYLIVLAAFTVALAMYTGKLYKAQIFYNGSGVNPVKRMILPFGK